MIRRERLIGCVLAALLSTGGQALATAVSGDRLFPSTLLIEDTQNDDEIALPTVSYLRRGANGDTSAGREFGITTEFSRSLTQDLSLLAGTGWRRLQSSAVTQRGWDNAVIGLKYRALVDPPHEFLASTAITYEIGGTDTSRVGAERFDTVQPVVSFGRGFGDLPRHLEWLRPAAVAGAFGLAVPTGSGPKMVRYGVTLQYSLIYRGQHTSLPISAWMARLVPLVEFAVESPVGRTYGTRTAAIAAPGVAWIGEDCQLTVEALVPLNSRAGRGVGVIAQVHLFLDELAPALFGKPLFGGD